MQGVYFDVAHVPFTAPTSLYPGLKLYLPQMKKYEPNYVYNEVAIQGWESAALFVQGVKMAGNNLTWANVIKQDNSITSFTAGGLRHRSTGRTPGTAATHRRIASPTSRWRGQVRAERSTRGRTSSTASSRSTRSKPVFPVPAGTPAPA